MGDRGRLFQSLYDSFKNEVTFRLVDFLFV